MKKVNLITFIFMVLLLSACQSSDSSITELDPNNMDKIQIVLAAGNPEYGAQSKTIINEDEIKEIVNAFNNAVIGKKVKDDDVAVTDSSTYYFYSNDGEVQQVSFNGNDSTRVWKESDWYYVTYSDKTPYELYKLSKAEIVIVNEDLEEIGKYIHRVSSEEVKKITPDMTYDDVIELLGETADVGSGVYVLAYIVDEKKTMLISFMDKDSGCGKTGEELLKELRSNPI